MFWKVYCYIKNSFEYFNIVVFLILYFRMNVYFILSYILDVLSWIRNICKMWINYEKILNYEWKV